jgi:hypothetical protein
LSHYFISIDKNGKKMKILKAGFGSYVSVKKAVFLSLWVFVLVFTGTLRAQERQAVLIRGNEWQAGIPGFGSNMFNALFGEYRLDIASVNADRAAAAAEDRFFVRVSREPLLFTSERWQLWPGIDGAMQRGEGDSLLVGFHFDSPNDAGSWTAVFQFSQGLSSMDPAGINRMINAWTRRFGYFLSLVKSFSDISLPAVVEF